MREIFPNFVFRVLEEEVDDHSTESLALVVTLAVVAGLVLITLSLALGTLIRTNIEDNKSRVMNNVLQD